MTNKNGTLDMPDDGLRFFTLFGMTGERLERGEGADTAATCIRKMVTVSAAVSAPSFFSRRTVIPNGTQWNEESHFSRRAVIPNGTQWNEESHFSRRAVIPSLQLWESNRRIMTPRSGKINSVGHRPTKIMNLVCQAEA